jgi:hypothetical protein
MARVRLILPHFVNMSKNNFPKRFVYPEIWQGHKNEGEGFGLLWSGWNDMHFKRVLRDVRGIVTSVEIRRIRSMNVENVYTFGRNEESRI